MAPEKKISHINGAFFKAAWQLVSAYWRSDQWRVAWAYLIASLFLSFLTVYISVQINYWNNSFFTALENREVAETYRLIGVYLALLAVNIGTMLINIHINWLLEIRWREWMTGKFLGEYLSDATFHQLSINMSGVENPDQRIAEDLKHVADKTLSYVLGFIENVVSTVTFIAILWSISPPLDVMVGDVPIYIPGYMVYVAVIYAVMTTWLTHLIGRPLIGIFNMQQAREADFRYGLIRIREYGESIALSKGEPVESRNLLGRFAAIKENWFSLLKYQKRLVGFKAVVGHGGMVFPLIVAAPLYLSGSITLGTLMQIRSAFLNVDRGLSWFQNMYQYLAEWKASVDRILALKQALDQTKAEKAGSRIFHRLSEDGTVCFEDLNLHLPNGRKLISEANELFRVGESVLITGPSGGGKTTLFRALSGLWPWGTGRIALGRGKAMFMPQKIYLPIGTLKAALTYPSTPETFPDADMARLLKACRLEAYVDRLNDEENWSQFLSGGEQQRCGFVRAILQRPDWLFMDEATSAIDPKTEQILYEVLKRELPETTLISIAHRKSLEAFHDRHIAVDGTIVTANI